MSREVVVRAGTGPLHIRTPGNPSAICGKPLPEKVKTWPRGDASLAVWLEWPTCPKCARLNQLLSR